MPRIDDGGCFHFGVARVICFVIFVAVVVTFCFGLGFVIVFARFITVTLLGPCHDLRCLFGVQTFKRFICYFGELGRTYCTYLAGEGPPSNAKYPYRVLPKHHKHHSRNKRMTLTSYH